MKSGEVNPSGGALAERSYDQVFVQYNPYSSQAELAYKHIDKLVLSKYGPVMLKPHATILDREAEDAFIIDTLLENGGNDTRTAVISLGGDGTSTRLLRPLLSDELAGLDISLLPVGCGDANDFAVMANGNPKKLSIEDTLDNGHTFRMKPIETNLIGPNGEELIVHAFSYVGFGNTAKLSERFNEDDHRAKIAGASEKKRLYEKGKIIVSQLPKSRLEEFVINEAGIRRPVNEITIVNGPRMAKFGKPDPYLKLSDPTLLKLTYENGNFIRSASWLGRLVMGRLAGIYLYDDDAYEFKIESDTLMHADAEVINLFAHTRVEVKQSQRSVSVISDLLTA